MTTDMSAQRAHHLCARILDEVEHAVVGKREALTLTLAGIVARGHVLIEDFPGLGKTLAARSFAAALGLDFRRAQFTPDLLPSDLTGSDVFNQSSSDFEFRPGPIFTQLLLADEINRTPPKTQAALLEAMQERQVSVEGSTHHLPSPFHVIATANPIETEGTYPLPEAQLDRFLMRVSFGYPSDTDEWELIRRRLDAASDDPQIERVVTADELLAIQRYAYTVHVSDGIGRYAVALTRATRTHQHALMGASPRGSLALVHCAQALALIHGRDYVVPEDIKHVAGPVLEHRVIIKPELWLQHITAAHVVASVLTSVPVPEASR